MKIMSRDFSFKEKILLLILALILLGAGYYLAVDQPVRNALNEAMAQQDSLNTELAILQQKAQMLSRMKSELEMLQKDSLHGRMGSYNNSKAELDELNQVLQEANTYNISFSNVSKDGDLIRRTFSLSFQADDYEKAEDLIIRLCKGEWRCLIGDIRFATSVQNLKEEGASVGLSATFYETMEGGAPDTGLPADTTEK